MFALARHGRRRPGGVLSACMIVAMAVGALLMPSSAAAATEPGLCAEADFAQLDRYWNCLRPPRASTAQDWSTDPAGNAIRVPQAVPAVTSPMRITAQISQLNDVMIRATYTLNLQRTLPYGECGLLRYVDDANHGSRPSINAPCGDLPGVKNVRWFNKNGSAATSITPGAQPPNMTFHIEQCAKFAGTPVACPESPAVLYQPKSGDPEQVSGYSEYHYINASSLGLFGSIMPACADDGINNGPSGISLAEFRCFPKMRMTWPTPSSGTVRIDIDLPKSIVNADKYVLFSVPESANLSDYFWADAAPGGLSDWVKSYADTAYDIALKIPKQSLGLPTASCTAALLPGTAGGVRFTSRSTDPSGMEPLAMWRNLSGDLPAGDDGTRVGSRADFRFTKPGSHIVELTAMGADGPATVNCQFTVPGPSLAVSVDYQDQLGAIATPPFDLNESVPVRVTVSATRPTGAVGSVSNITFNANQSLGKILKQSDANPGANNTVVLGGPAGTAIPAFELAAGKSRSFYTTITTAQADAFGRFNISSSVSGKRVERSGVSTVDVTVNPSAGTNAGEFGDGVDVQVQLDPPAPEAPQSEDDGVDDQPAPVDLTATLVVKNTSTQTITDLEVDAVEIASAVNTAGARTAFDLAVAPKSFPVPVTGQISQPIDVSDQLPAGGLPVGGEVTIHGPTGQPFTFHITNDVKVQVKARITAKSATNTFLDSHTKKWKLDPKYRVAFTYEQSRPDPQDEPLLPAGAQISIRGTVKNLSGTDTLTVGPLYPQLQGNATGQSFAWDTNCGDVADFQPAEPKELAPNETVHWTLCVTTSHSDAKKPADPNDRSGGFGAPGEANGGTRARLFFSPWATYVDEDGETQKVDPDEYKVDRGELEAWEDPSTTQRDAAGAKAEIHIDDSVAIPATNGLVTVGAFGVGTIKGIGTGAIGLLTLPSQLIYATYTTTSALIEFQTQAWYAMDTGEQKALLNDLGPRVYAQLVANVEYAEKTYPELRQEIDAALYKFFLDQQNEWYVGDSYKVAEFYGQVFGETLDTGAVVSRTARMLRIGMPIIARTMAASPVVRRALERFDNLRRARYETEQLPRVIAATTHLDPRTRFERIGEALYEIESGTKMTADDIARLFAIDGDELDELQAIADELNILMTVRSRHGSSIAWIREGAELKPEALKIKSVSELDARLGYRYGDIGSLVFRKPLALELFEQELLAFPNTTKTLKEFVEQYVDDLIEHGPSWSPGAGAGMEDITLQASQRGEAIERLVQKAEEWKKFEKKYKAWTDMADNAPPGTEATGWLDRTFDGVGNAVSQDAMKVNAENRLFRMKRVVDAEGVEAYELFLWNPQKGKFGRVTGDIDAIAFTHVDGTPLSELEHAQVLLRTRGSSRLKAPHAESATFVGKPGEVHDGVAFVKSQFKEKVVDGKRVMEGALQIAPGGSAAGRPPRLVRLNDDPNKSLWKSPFDYKLHWDGGFNDVGTRAVPNGAVPPLVTASTWTDVQNMPSAPAIEPGALPRPIAGAQQAGGEPTLGVCVVTYSTQAGVTPYVLTADGKVGRVTGGIDGAPSVVIVDEELTAACKNPANVGMRITMMPATMVTGAVPAGATEVPIAETSVARDARNGLAVGSQVLIGAGTNHAETRTITGFGSIILDRPLTFAHGEREAIVVLRAAPRAWDPPATGAPTPPAADTTPLPAPTPAAAGAKPKLKTLPSITGARKLGAKLTCKPGAWTGTAPIKYTIAWQRKIGTKWIAIKRASTAAYKVAAVDSGKQLRCVVTARNATGTLAATSKPITIARAVKPRR